MIELQKNKKLILFDGVCNLCNSSIQFIIKNDKKNLFLFSPLQGDIGQEIIKSFNINNAKIDSVLLYSKKDGLSQKSTAALKIAHQLGFPQNLLSVFFIVPRFIRDWIYEYIAQNRSKWFGKRDSCMVPTPDLQSKFIN